MGRKPLKLICDRVTTGVPWDYTVRLTRRLDCSMSLPQFMRLLNPGVAARRKFSDSHQAERQVGCHALVVGFERRSECQAEACVDGVESGRQIP